MTDQREAVSTSHQFNHFHDGGLAMERDYKEIAEKLALEVSDIETSLECATYHPNALLQTLVNIGVITAEQLTERKKDWWEKNVVTGKPTVTERSRAMEWKYDWWRIGGEPLAGLTPREVVKKYGMRGHAFNRKSLANMIKIGEVNPAKKETLSQAVSEVEAKLRQN